MLKITDSIFKFADEKPNQVNTSSIVNNVIINNAEEEKKNENKISDGVTAQPSLQNIHDENNYLAYGQFNDRIIYLTNEVSIYKMINKILLSNPLFINKLIIANQKDLTSLVELLTQQKCRIILSEENMKCCGKKTDYDIIEEINLIDDNKNIVGNLKYSFNNVYLFIKSQNISLKMCT